jgi:hypothetical protein
MTASEKSPRSRNSLAAFDCSEYLDKVDTQWIVGVTSPLHSQPIHTLPWERLSES